MTMPTERTRALLWAGEFLREVQMSETLPEKLKTQASWILRHYPEAGEIVRAAASPRAGSWLAPVEQHGDWH
jgi:hypothetical protein